MIFEGNKAPFDCLLKLFLFALRLVENARAALPNQPGQTCRFSTNQVQTQNKLWIGFSNFPALARFYCELIGSLRYKGALWLDSCVFWLCFYELFENQCREGFNSRGRDNRFNRDKQQIKSEIFINSQTNQLRVVKKLTSFSFPRNSKQTATLFTACAET